MQYNPKEFEIEGTTLIKYIGIDAICTIPEFVTKISEGAFLGNEKLKNIVIPNSITYIEKNAFWNCKNLERIHIPENVKEIGWSAFQGCENLVSVILPQNLYRIEPSLFSGCKRLNDITIPNNLVYLSSHAFENCSSLSFLFLPDSLEFIGDYAFEGCNLLSRINIPGKTTVGKEIFKNCTNKMFVELSETANIQWNSFANENVTVNETNEYYFNNGYAFKKNKIKPNNLLNKKHLFINGSYGHEKFIGLKSDGTIAYVRDFCWDEDGNECGFCKWNDIVSIEQYYSRECETELCIGIKATGEYLVERRKGVWDICLPEKYKYKSIGFDGYFAYGLTVDGTVIIDDDKYDYRYEEKNIPIKIESISQEVLQWKNIKQLIVGYNSIVGLKNDGTVVAAGDDDKLCLVEEWSNIQQIADGGSVICGLQYDGTVVAVYLRETYDSKKFHHNFSNWNDIIQICAYGEFIAGLRSDGKVMISIPTDVDGNYTGYYQDYFQKDIIEIEKWENIIELFVQNSIIVGLKSNGSLVTNCERLKYIEEWKLF